MNGPRYDHAFVSLGARTVEPTPLRQNQSTDLIVEGARQNNLKNISLRIPHNQVTAITGVSGSGDRKSVV